MLLTSNIMAQPEDTSNVTDKRTDTSGEIIIIKDNSIDEVITQYIIHNATSPGIEGFRVQIYNDSGNNARTRAMEVKEAFESAFPDIPAHLQYQQPNFKIRVGDCRTRLEARRIQKIISSRFPDAFIVKDFIKKTNP